MAATEITASNQYLTFKLDQEIYALDITQVREVLDYTEITKVPRMPAFMRGVINLRGGVVPVVDLRLKFEMEDSEKTVDSCIIIMELDIEGDKTYLGALADSVQEVITLEADQIEPPPKIGTRLDTEFIRGMGKRNNELIIILDIDRVFSSGELDVIQAAEDINSSEIAAVDADSNDPSQEMTA